MYESDNPTTFVVSIDGVKYKNSWLMLDGDRIAAVGNLMYASGIESDDTGEPYLLAVDEIVLFTDVPKICKISVGYLRDEVHKIDPKFIGNLSYDDGTLSILGDIPLADINWEPGFLEFTSAWFLEHFFKIEDSVGISINEKVFRTLQYTSTGRYSAKLGDVNTDGVEIIVNDTRYPYNTPITVNVSHDRFPDGVSNASVFVTRPFRITADTLPENMEWMASKTLDYFLTKDSNAFVSDNETVQSERVNNFSYTPFNVSSHSLMLMIHSGTYPEATGQNVVKTTSLTGSAKLAPLKLDGSPVESNEWPETLTILAAGWGPSTIYLVNPANQDVIISSSTADSTKKFRITVDDSGTISATEVTT